MRKQRVYLLISIITVAIFATLLVLQNKKGKFDSFNVSTEEYKEIISTRMETEQFLISNFKFNGYPLALSERDEVNIEKVSCLELEESEEFPEGEAGYLGDRYLYSISENQKNAYNPIVDYKTTNEEQAEMPLNNGSEVNIAIEDAYITVDEIENNREYKMVAYNDSYYHEYIISMTTLPIIEINYDEKITKWDSSQAEIIIRDNGKNAVQPYYVSDATIRLRGGSSIDYPKHAFRISLTGESLGLNKRKNMPSLLGMRQDDDWILYAAYNDQERVRNVFSSNLWMEANAERNQFGIKNGMEYRYCELLVNGDYRGLYALGHPIDAKELRLNTDKLSSPYDYLFKKIDWDNERNITNDTDGEVDGYKIASNINFGDILTDDENNEMLEDITFEAEKNAWGILRSYWYDVFNTYDIAEIYRHTDIKSAIDLYLYFVLIQGDDSADGESSKNWYISFKEDKDHYVAMFTPWDMDVSWGNSYAGEEKNRTKPYGHVAEENWMEMVNNPVYALMEKGDERIIDLIKEEYSELRAGKWSEESISNMINEYEKWIFDSGAYNRDILRWPNSSYLDTPEIKLTDFKKYVLDRFNYMDKYVDELE